MIGIENGNIFAAGVCQGMINIARFRMRVIVAADVARTYLRGKISKLRTMTIVKQENFAFIRWIVQCERTEDGSSYDTERFIIGWNKNVDRRPILPVSHER